MSEIHGRRPRRCKFEFWFMRNISHHRKNLGHGGKIETLPILPTCYRPSQTIGDIYDFEFALVSKIWESPEPIKSPIVWDFPDVWKPGLKLHTYMYMRRRYSALSYNQNRQIQNNDLRSNRAIVVTRDDLPDTHSTVACVNLFVSSLF